MALLMVTLSKFPQDFLSEKWVAEVQDDEKRWKEMISYFQSLQK